MKEKFYIGIADLRDDDRKSFRGFVSDFAYWNKVIENFNRVCFFRHRIGHGVL